MTVHDLIEVLRNFPPGANVILLNDLGASELEDTEISYDEMNYVRYDSGTHFIHNWEFPDEHKRNVLRTERVVVIRS